MKILVIIKDTFRELFVRKTLVGFLIFNVLGLICIAIFVNSGTIGGIVTAQQKTMTPELYESIVHMIEVGVMNTFYIVLIFISIFSTASVIPSVLEKGTIDLYLSKPIARWELLLGKILGSILVVAANIGVFMIGAWIILSWRLGEWNTGFIAAAPVLLFAFIVLYSVIVLCNLLTRGSAVGIIVTFVHFILLSSLLANRDTLLSFIENKFWRGVIDWVYYLLPQTHEHSLIASSLVTHGEIMSWFPIWASGIFASVMFGMAGWLFQKKDF